MAYKVLAPFYDLQDGEHYYEKGTTFPRADAGYKPDKDRFAFIESVGFIENDDVDEAIEEVTAEPKKRGRRKKATDETEE